MGFSQNCLTFPVLTFFAPKANICVFSACGQHSSFWIPRTVPNPARMATQSLQSFHTENLKSESLISNHCTFNHRQVLGNHFKIYCHILYQISNIFVKWITLEALFSLMNTLFTFNIVGHVFITGLSPKSLLVYAVVVFVMEFCHGIFKFIQIGSYCDEGPTQSHQLR